MIENPFTEDEEIGRNQSEYKLQLAVVKHLTSAFPGLLYTHAANRPSGAADGYFKKLMGLRAGTPDLLFWWSTPYYEYNVSPPTHKIHCGAIELKTSTGKVSNDQNRFASSFTHIGGKFAVCRTVQGVHDALLGWGIVPTHHAILEPDLRSKQKKKVDSFDWFKP